MKKISSNIKSITIETTYNDEESFNFKSKMMPYISIYKESLMDSPTSPDMYDIYVKH